MNNFDSFDMVSGAVIYGCILLLMVLVLLLAVLASLYFIIKLSYKIKENKKYIFHIFVSFIVLVMSCLQMYSFYSMYIGYNSVDHDIKDIEDDVIVHFLNAAKFSPFVNFKTFAYEQAGFIYEAYNTKEKFNHEKHLRYKLLASKYDKENMKYVMLSAIDYGYYEVARRAALETKEYYWAALASFLMKDYQNALMYIDKSEINKDKISSSNYLLKGVVYKNMGNEKLSEENFNKAKENCKKDVCRKRIEKAYKNYKTFYKDEARERYKTHINTFGY